MSMTQINEYYLYYRHTLHKNRIHIQTYYVIVSALYFVIILTKKHRSLISFQSYILHRNQSLDLHRKSNEKCNTRLKWLNLIRLYTFPLLQCQKQASLAKAVKTQSLHVYPGKLFPCHQTHLIINKKHVYLSTRDYIQPKNSYFFSFLDIRGQGKIFAVQLVYDFGCKRMKKSSWQTKYRVLDFGGSLAGKISTKSWTEMIKTDLEEW